MTFTERELLLILAKRIAEELHERSATRVYLEMLIEQVEREATNESEK